MNQTVSNALKGVTTLLAGGATAGVAAVVAQCGVSAKELLSIGGTAFLGAVVHLLMDKPKKS